MISYFITDDAGVVIGTGTVATREDAERDGSPYGTVHILEEGSQPAPYSHKLSKGRLEPLPARPDSFAEWGGKAWQDTRSDADRLDEIRAQRDALLSASDWTQMPDAPMSDNRRAAWKAYRQALRDMPASGGAWPSRPDETE